MDQGIKSRPRYSPLRLDPAGTRHLLVTDHATPPASAWEGGVIPPGMEVWCVAHRSDATGHHFRSITQLQAMLLARLKRETMGLRLYAAGSEIFIWDIAALARNAGLGSAEFHLTLAGSAKRRVYCPHCKSMTSGVSRSVVSCSGCGAALFVRDHFSRLHAAYTGVRVDAEVPGVIPPAEELYP